jgi:hypothetical protein
VTRWPIWRLLIWLESWLLAVAIFHRYRPIHDEFVVPLLIAVLPAAVLVAMWALARAATEQRTAQGARATWVELLIACVTVVAAATWAIRWAAQAREDLRQIDAVLGQATIIVDVSLTWLSIGACFAALTLDGLLAVAGQRLRDAMHWLRRTHLFVTVVHIGALFGSAWLFTRVPDLGTADNAAFFERARIALHVYEYAKATVFPVQAVFASLAVAVTAADSRSSQLHGVEL